MELLGSIFMIIGMLIAAFTSIWFLVVAFKTSVLWGLGCLFVPFVSLIFLIMHWDDAKRPFLWSLLAIIPIVAGVMLVGPQAASAY